jgi:hypothetical protein
MRVTTLTPVIGLLRARSGNAGTEDSLIMEDG